MSVFYYSKNNDNYYQTVYNLVLRYFLAIKLSGQIRFLLERDKDLYYGSCFFVNQIIISSKRLWKGIGSVYYSCLMCVFYFLVEILRSTSLQYTAGSFSIAFITRCVNMPGFATRVRDKWRLWQSERQFVAEHT